MSWWINCYHAPVEEINASIGVGVLLLVSTLLFALPFQELAALIAQGLTISLVDLGDSWIAWVFAPINNIASLLLLSVKAIRVFRKKIINASHAN